MERAACVPRRGFEDLRPWLGPMLPGTGSLSMTPPISDRCHNPPRRRTKVNYERIHAVVHVEQAPPRHAALARWRLSSAWRGAIL